MHNTYTSFLGALGGLILGAFSYLHPWAATGAVFGCFFFMTMQPEISKLKKLMLTIVSWGAGYASGVWMYGEGPPWSQKAMIVGFIGSALAVVLMTSLHAFIQNGGNIPTWLQTILDKLSLFPKKGGQ